MRKVFIFIMATLEGYYEGIDHDLSWHNTDEEFATFGQQQLDEADTLVFGHKTYKTMADYWPTQQALTDDHSTAVRMNTLHKVVFSHQTFDTDWDNTEVCTNLAQKIQELKAQSGKSIAVLGSSHLGKVMLETGLIDEVRIMVNPVFIGQGSTVFEGLRKELELTSARIFKNGNILLSYRAC